MVAALVVAMVIVGGATRLTDSGLSITQWQPILGAIPPMSDADWQAAFEHYKQIPQYAIVNKGMSLEAFKEIYWWEWAHRLLGRLIGVVFALPLLGFWFSGRLRPGMAPKFAGVLALGGLQGLVGWYMVKSGLADRVLVSPYWLAFHLVMAFTIIALLVWLALEEGEPRRRVTGKAAPPSVHTLAAILVAMVGLQVVLGAFVAGLKAGLIYNTWPTMDGQVFPSDYWIAGAGWRSFFESHAAAQFNHRVLAYLVGLAAVVQAVRIARRPADDRIRISAYALVAAVLVQMSLGIWTLIAHVPLWLGLLHQAGAAIVLMVAVVHLHAARRAGVVAGLGQTKH
jgi:cytochrome c oxidase assembly protein subunit 15